MGRNVTAMFVALGSVVAGLVGVAATPASAAATGSPVGAFTDVSARFDGDVALGGFALDPDAPGQPVKVRIYEGPQFLTELTTAPAPGGTQPVTWSWPAGAADPTRTLCAYAINVGPGENTSLGCRPLVIASDARFNPVGSLVAVIASPALVQLKGWAGDPDGDRTTQIRVYYDGKLVAQKTAGGSRPDVARAIPAVGPTTGFNVALPIAPGAHQICVYAQNTGVHGTANATLGCATRSVPGVRPAGPHDPRGSYDDIGSGPGPVFPNTIHSADGWAFDPDTAGPVTVRIRTLMYRYFVEPPFLHQNKTLTTGRARPDVAATVPGAGPNTGFQGVVASGSFSYVRISCAYVENVGPGADRLIGCDTEDAPSIVRAF
jgi:hypothetical protein